MNNQINFNNFTYNSKCTIWRISYLNKDKEYDIKNYYNDEYNIISFNNSLTYNGICINELNYFYGELCTMYYVWKNNLKSDIVGFDQYRRQFSYIDFNKINNNKIQVYNYFNIQNNIINGEYNSLGCFLYSFLLYLKYNTQYDINNLIFNSNYILNNFNIFICKWDIFDKLCKIIFGYLEYILPNNQWLNINSIQEYINFNVKFHNTLNFNNCPICTDDRRHFLYLLECINGLIFNMISTSFKNDNKQYCVIYNCYSYDDYKNILKLYPYNIGNGIDYVFIKDHNNIFLTHYNKDNYNSTEFRQLNLYENNNNLNNIYKIEEDIIELIKEDNVFIDLNNNEYIYANNSINLHNDKYIIQSI